MLWQIDVEIFKLHLALKIGNQFILNGRWQIKSNKLFYAASSIFKYVIITRNEGKMQEKIVSTGPLADIGTD